MAKEDKKPALESVRILRGTVASGHILAKGRTYKVGKPNGEDTISEQDALFLISIKKAENTRKAKSSGE